MTSAQQSAYQRVAPKWVVPLRALTPTTALHFCYPHRPLVIEIGSGMGEALAHTARRSAHINYLAFEVYRPGVARLLWCIERYHLHNVKIVEGDCMPVLYRSDGRVLDGVRVHFPDPWPKARHHKRRLLDSHFFAALTPLLRSAAYISVATDNAHYAGTILSAIRSTPLINPYGGYAPPQAWRRTTAFEQRALEAHRTIYEIFVRAP